MRTALYAGSFDPLTNGHIDVVEKALKAFDHLVILVANNSLKKYSFTLEERVEMLREHFKNDPRITIESTDGLTVRKAHELNITAMVRGLRDVVDFESEQRLYITNQALDPNIETFYVMASPAKIFISSINLKQMFKSGEDISPYAPKAVLDAMIKNKERFL